MKEILIGLISTFLIALIGAYLIYAYILASWNPQTWTAWGRGCSVITVFFFWFMENQIILKFQSDEENS